jgi:hypothetical protein
MEGDKRFPKMSQASESKMGEEREFERESTARFDDRMMSRRCLDFRVKLPVPGRPVPEPSRALSMFSIGEPKIIFWPIQSLTASLQRC